MTFTLAAWTAQALVGQAAAAAEFWTESLRQTPALAIVALIVGWMIVDGRRRESAFLKHLDSLEDRRAKRETAEDTRANACHAFADRQADQTRNVMEKVLPALAITQDASERAIEATERMSATHQQMAQDVRGLIDEFRALVQQFKNQ